MELILIAVSAVYCFLINLHIVFLCNRVNLVHAFGRSVGPYPCFVEIKSHSSKCGSFIFG